MKSVLEFLENTVKIHSEKIAVKDINGQCTFEELYTDSRRIGTALCKYKVSEKVIPVFMEKGILTLEVFFGIVYAGGAYSLLNPIQPGGRLETILKTLEAPVIITDAAHVERMRELEFQGTVLLAEELVQETIDEESLMHIRECMVDTAPLYVNFTSGSTGVPKGVVVGHKSVIEFIQYFTSLFCITSEDIIGNQAPFDFDVSVKDIYSMLLTGATMYIIPRDVFSFPKKLLDILVEEKITTLIWAVSALCIITSLKGFNHKIPTAVNKVLFSGEVMPLNHLEEWRRALPEAVFVNLYGPTEVTCNCTYYVMEPGAVLEQGLPIGKPFPNEKVFLLDENQKEITGPNVEGEICVAGSTLALGYFRDRDKTAKAFIQNPLNDRYNELIYCTGDVGKYRADGNLVYVGRKDFQIKHMGHRIELFEIDAHINMIQGIERVCCLYDDQKKQIVAIYQGNVDKATIKSELKKKIIKYMIPEKFINVEQMPINANGKIDRKKLTKEYIEG